MQLRDFLKKVKITMLETLRYQQSTGKAKEDSERDKKLYLPHQRGITERISRLR